MNSSNKFVKKTKFYVIYKSVPFMRGSWFLEALQVDCELKDLVDDTLFLATAIGKKTPTI